MFLWHCFLGIIIRIIQSSRLIHNRISSFIIVFFIFWFRFWSQLWLWIHYVLLMRGLIWNKVFTLIIVILKFWVLHRLFCSCTFCFWWVSFFWSLISASTLSRIRFILSFNATMICKTSWFLTLKLTYIWLKSASFKLGIFLILLHLSNFSLSSLVPKHTLIISSFILFLVEIGFTLLATSLFLFLLFDLTCR